MRAAGITAAGGVEVLSVVERTIRDPCEGEVRITVEAAAVNPTDILLRTRGCPHVPPPWTPGMDAAGVVEAVGPGVERIRVGDRVMAAVVACRPDGGAQAEAIVVPAASVVPVPDGLTASEAATLPMNGLTAKLGLAALRLEPGQTLAVTGAAGVVASYVIPLARRRGLRVVADAKAEDEGLVRGFGADFVVPRGDGFVRGVRAAESGGADGLIDAALLYDRALGAVSDGGRAVFLRGERRTRTERGVHVERIAVSTALDRTDWLEEVRRAASARLLQPRIVEEVPLEAVAAAHARLEAGGVRGRLVITFR